MRAYRAISRCRLGCVSLVLAGLLAGCGGPAPQGVGGSSSADPKGGLRRKAMEDYMKNQPPGGAKKS